MCYSNKNEEEFQLWLKQKFLYSWHRKYQNPALYENWLTNLTSSQKAGFYKQFVQDKLQLYAQKIDSKTEEMVETKST